jgi:hypothetical protein
VPFFEITLETANKFYEWGWRASIAGAVIIAVGVILLMYGTRVRDRDTESQLSSAKLLTAQTSEKAAALQVRAEELKGENLKTFGRNFTVTNSPRIFERGSLRRVWLAWLSRCRFDRKIASQ